MVKLGQIQHALTEVIVGERRLEAGRMAFAALDAELLDAEMAAVNQIFLDVGRNLERAKRTLDSIASDMMKTGAA